MNAELWLVKLGVPCVHGWMEPHCIHNGLPDGEYCCEGGSRVRLDPERVVIELPDQEDITNVITVQDVIDALTALTEQEPCPACGSTIWGECGWCA